MKSERQRFHTTDAVSLTYLEMTVEIQKRGPNKKGLRAS